MPWRLAARPRWIGWRGVLRRSRGGREQRSAGAVVRSYSSRARRLGCGRRNDSPLTLTMVFSALKRRPAAPARAVATDCTSPKEYDRERYREIGDIGAQMRELQSARAPLRSRTPGSSTRAMPRQKSTCAARFSAMTVCCWCGDDRRQVDNAGRLGGRERHAERPRWRRRSSRSRASPRDPSSWPPFTIATSTSPPSLFHSWKVFFICEITGGAPRSNETDAVDFFPLEALPELSDRPLDGHADPPHDVHHQHLDLPTEFD